MKLFSGIQPTNDLHLGNYLGAIKQWIDLQDDHAARYCVVDLHAITIAQDPAALKRNTLSTAMLIVALGVDPERSPVFVQSQVKEHTELAWILATISKMGELERMTQFKDKAARFPKKINVALFTYPILMAADVLLYQAEGVPVGEDQKQHVELMRDLAERFNATFGDVLTVPQPLIQKEGARIMSLADPTVKMSKSDPKAAAYIALIDDEGTVRDKIKKAVTDSGEGIVAAESKPALTNLLTIYAHLANTSVADLERRYAGKGYGAFKTDLAEVVVNFLRPVQERVRQFEKEPEHIAHILAEGAKTARAEAAATMQRVKEAVGLL